MDKLPLFERYPGLRERIPYVPIATLPTPVRPLEALGESLGAELWLKDDGPSGVSYGGNKVRKLGFLLASAKQDGAETVLTFGAAGSNHALATAIYAKALGLRSISMLVPQPPAHSVRRNLLRQLAAGAEVHYRNGLGPVAVATCWQFAVHSVRSGKFPRVIATGGSSPLGIVGFVNAVFELKQQIERGELPEPEVIYVAAGSMGTAVGLALGTQLAGMKTRIQAVRVTGERFTNLERGRKLYQSTNELLHYNDPGVPLVPFPESTFEVRHDFYGDNYALYTPAGMEAVKLTHELEGLRLEGTYSGKAMACLISDARAGRITGRALFWNTYNSVDFHPDIAGADYHDLPQALHRYFEEAVQPLDEKPIS